MSRDRRWIGITIIVQLCYINREMLSERRWVMGLKNGRLVVNSCGSGAASPPVASCGGSSLLLTAAKWVQPLFKAGESWGIFGRTLWHQKYKQTLPKQHNRTPDWLLILHLTVCIGAHRYESLICRDLLIQTNPYLTYLTYLPSKHVHDARKCRFMKSD